MGKFYNISDVRQPWRFQWHTIPERTKYAEKPFFPGGSKISKGSIESALSYHKESIIDSGNRLFERGIELKLGNELLSDIANRKVLGWYLYKNVIHPKFFAEALEVIADECSDLGLRSEDILLTKLDRYSIASAVKGAIRESDIGVYFENFENKTPNEKIEILKALGVLKLKEKPVEEPKPKVLNIDPRAKFALVKIVAEQIESLDLPASIIDFNQVYVSPKIKGKVLERILAELKKPEVAKQLGSTLKLLSSLEAKKVSVKAIRTKEGWELRIRPQGLKEEFDSASILLKAGRK